MFIFSRYLAICHLLGFRLTTKNARTIIIGIWIFAIAIMSPWAVYYEQNAYMTTPLQTIYVCEQIWPSVKLQGIYFLIAIFLTCYTIPLVWISVCYLLISCKVWNRRAPGVANANQLIYKSKVKVLKMLIVVVVLFSLSWLPLYAVNVRIHFGSKLDTNSSEFLALSQVIIPVAQWLGSSNSCINPVIYCFFSNKFRHGFKRMIKCCKVDSRGASVIRNNSTLYFSVNNGINNSIRCTVSHCNSPINRKPNRLISDGVQLSNITSSRESI